VTYRLKQISRQLAFAREFLKLRKVLPELMNLAAALRDQISQSPEQEITLSTEALPLAFVGCPLVAKNPENLSDLLEYLAAEAPALLADLQTFVNVHLCSAEHVNAFLEGDLNELPVAVNVTLSHDSQWATVGKHRHKCTLTFLLVFVLHDLNYSRIKLL
jgi:hypothetical protein